MQIRTIRMQIQTIQKHFWSVRTQILTIRKGFKAFESKFEPFK